MDRTHLHELLEEFGGQQKRLAVELRISPSMLSQVKHGKKSASVELLRRIARRFECTVDALLTPAESDNRADA